MKLEKFNKSISNVTSSDESIKSTLDKIGYIIETFFVKLGNLLKRMFASDKALFKNLKSKDSSYFKYPLKTKGIDNVEVVRSINKLVIDTLTEHKWYKAGFRGITDSVPNISILDTLLTKIKDLQKTIIIKPIVIESQQGFDHRIKELGTIMSNILKAINVVEKQKDALRDAKRGGMFKSGASSKYVDPILTKNAKIVNILTSIHDNFRKELESLSKQTD